MRRSCGHDWRLVLGALWTLLAWCGVAPQAHAGCEMPTVVVSSTSQDSHEAVIGSASSATFVSLSHHSIPGRRPCSGPHCSRAPLVPPTPPVIAESPNQEWACLAVIPDGADHKGIAHFLEDNSQTPIFRASRIYHPPR